MATQYVEAHGQGDACVVRSGLCPCPCTCSCSCPCMFSTYTTMTSKVPLRFTENDEEKGTQTFPATNELV
jgi:hypothetical protein